MMKRVGLLIVAVALGLAVVAEAAQGTGKISGIARDSQDIGAGPTAAIIAVTNDASPSR